MIDIIKTYPILECVGQIVERRFLWQFYQKTQGVALHIGLTVVLAMALGELCALARSPGVTKFVVTQGSLKVAVLPAPTQSRGSALGHLLYGDLVVPTSSVHSWRGRSY